MFCSQCGSELPKGAKFCVKCGALAAQELKQGSSSGGSSGGSVISILKPYEPPKVLDCLTCGGSGKR